MCGQIREREADLLLERLGRQSRLEGLDACFPLQVLRLEASALEFYDFYGV